MGFTIKSIPFVVVTDFSFGNFLYPEPNDKIFNEFTGPDADNDDVE